MDALRAISALRGNTRMSKGGDHRVVFFSIFTDNLAENSKVTLTQLVSNILFFNGKQHQSGKKNNLELKTSLTKWS